MADSRQITSVRRYLSRSMMLLVLGTLLTLSAGGWFLLISPSLDSLARARISQLSAMLEGELRLLAVNTERLLKASADWLQDDRLTLDHRTLNQRFMPLLEQYPEYSSMLVADTTGSEWMLFQKADGSWLNRLSSPTDKAKDGKHRFLHWSKTRELELDERLASDYSTMTRPWFREATRSPLDTLAWTEIYRFYNTAEPGVTASLRTPSPQGRELVIGLDLRLTDIARYLNSIKVGREGMAMILSNEGRLLGLSTLDQQPASSLKDIIYQPVVNLSIEPLQKGVTLWLERTDEQVEDQWLFHGLELWHIGYRRLQLGDEGLWLGVYLPLSELIPGLRYQLLVLLSVLLLALATALKLALRAARNFSLPLEALANHSRRIGDLDFNPPPDVRSAFNEINQLALAQERMRGLLSAAHSDLQKKNQQLLETQEQLIQAAKLESVGRLAAGVAHEVKNPLAIMQMGIDYLRGEAIDADTREVLTDMDDAVGRADNVVKGLLDFSRQRRLDLEPGDINDVIRSSLRLVEHEFTQHNTEVHLELADQLPRLLLDADKLRQVLINLFINAIQAMGQNGALTIASGVRALTKHSGLDRDTSGLFQDGEQALWVEVRDSGPGISEHQRERLFDPFFTTKAVGQGTGLGLSVSRNIIEQHHASIDLRNGQNGGASALLLFKLDDANTDETTHSSRR
jgi:signal transduction histidine kinase